MKFTGTITVYNSAEVDFKKMLFPHLLNSVHVEKTRGAESAADGDKNTDNLLVIIPFKTHKNGFLTPLEFEKCEEKSEHWTLSPGDIISVGDTMSQSQRQNGSMDAAQPSVGGDTGAADNFAELTARAETFRIISVKTFDFGGLPHWEVTAK